MAEPIIKVENLSKSYFIGHQQQERYTALRDILTNSLKGFAKNTANLFRGRQLLGNEDIEEFFALKDLNFEINQGDRVGIIGRNGAGKSTLLKVLSRITEPTTGRITINGRIASLLEVGTGFHPELTGRENIYLNGAILGMSRNEVKRKFDEIVDFAEVEKFLDTPVKRYSSGMYVRLAFAVAAHLEPEILIVDEVLAVGDIQFQKKCLGKMQDVSNNQGRTVLFVSHNLNAIEQLCNKGIHLIQGKIDTIGPVKSCIEAYNIEPLPSEIKTLKPSNILSNIEIKSDALTLGDNLKIRFLLNSNHVPKGLVVAVELLNANDELISHIINEDDNFEFTKGMDSFVLELKNLRLIPGKYFLTVWFGYNYSQTIEEHTHVVKFRITNSPTQVNRIIPFPKHSKLVINSTWTRI